MIRRERWLKFIEKLRGIWDSVVFAKYIIRDSMSDANETLLRALLLR